MGSESMRIQAWCTLNEAKPKQRPFPRPKATVKRWRAAVGRLGDGGKARFDGDTPIVA